MPPLPQQRLLRFCVLMLAVVPLSNALAVGAPPPVAMRVQSGRLFLPLRVNGTPTEALLDSAAEMTIVDSAYARTLKLALTGADVAHGSGGDQATRFADHVTLEAGGVRLGPQTVAVLDLKDVSERLVHAPVTVVLGRELFDAARLEIDINGGTLRRLSRATRPPGVELALAAHAGIESVPVTVEGNAANADLDLGNGTDVLIGRQFALAHGLLRPERIVERAAGGGIGGGIEREVIVLARLEIAGRSFENVRATVDPLPTAGELNIGVSILREFVLVTDFHARRVWLRAH